MCGQSAVGSVGLAKVSFRQVRRHNKAVPVVDQTPALHPLLCHCCNNGRNWMVFAVADVGCLWLSFGFAAMVDVCWHDRNDGLTHPLHKIDGLH